MAEQNPIRQESLAFLEKARHVMDSLDISVLDQLYTPDAVLRFNNQEFHGLDAIRGFFSEQYASLQSMKHTVVHFDTVGDTIYQAADITYVIKDDPDQIAIPIRGMANFFRDATAGTTTASRAGGGGGGGAEEGGAGVGGVGAGEEEQGRKLVRFEVYLDSMPIVKRVEEIAALRAK